MRWTPIDGVLDEDLPAVAGLLQSIEVERHEIVEEEALDLAAEDVYSGAQDVQ